MGKELGIVVDMQTISYAEASENLEAVMDKAAADCVPIAITCEHSEGVVLVSESKWASMNEALNRER